MPTRSRFQIGAFSLMYTSRSGSANWNGRRNSELIRLKTTMFAAMPSVSIATTSAVAVR